MLSENEYNDALKNIDRLISENFEDSVIKQQEFLAIARAIQQYEKKYYPITKI